MKKQTDNTKKATECAACGGIILGMGTGRHKEFCSEACRKSGRSFCRMCKEPLIQSMETGQRKEFCSQRCMHRYHRVGEISPTLIEEYNRNSCLVCDNQIAQPAKNGRKRRFCSDVCMHKYHYHRNHGQSLYEEWGSYEPEVRKVLREMQLHMGIGAAKRLATAIDREYTPRRKARKPENDPQHKGLEQVN